MRKNILFFGWVFYCLFLLNVNAEEDNIWLTDFDEAKEIAKKENKIVLLNFSGSDWCEPCMRLEKEVFSKKEFIKYAEENLVLVLVDFPQEKQLSKKQEEHNEELEEQYKVEGFPTIILCNKKGKEIFRTGYRKGGVHKYIRHLQEELERAEGN